jgi:hypothetical protein
MFMSSLQSSLHSLDTLVGHVLAKVCIYSYLLAAVDKYKVSSLKTLHSGAAPLGGPLVTAVKEKLKSRGADVVVTQGLLFPLALFSLLLQS